MLSETGDLIGRPRRVQGIPHIGCYEQPCGGLILQVK